MSKTNKKIFKEKHLNSVLLETYKQEESNVGGSPVIASFKINITTENTTNLNGRVYPSSVWNQPLSFGRGGKYIDENGKLRPLSLLGNLDHPREDTGEVYLAEAGLIWSEVNQDGMDWDGKVHVLDTPQGRIIKTFLDYAKIYGGGEQIGVSTRALGDAAIVESTNGMVEEILPDGFELVSIDFVYNPSSIKANNPLLESKSKTNRVTLVESIKKLKEADKTSVSKEIYDNVIKDLERDKELDKLSIDKVLTELDKIVPLSESVATDLAKEDYLKQLKETEYKLYNAIYKIENMTDDEWKQTKYYIDTPEKASFLTKLRTEYDSVTEELKKAESITENVDTVKDEGDEVKTEQEKEIKDKVNETETELGVVTEAKAETEPEQEPEDKKDKDNPDETEPETKTEPEEEPEEEPEKEEEPETDEDKFEKIFTLLEDIALRLDEYFGPVLDLEPETDLGLEDDLDLDPEQDEFSDEIETDFTDEDIDNMSEEELESLSELLELE